MNALQRYTRTLLCSAGFLATTFLAACGGGGDQGRDPILGLPAADLVSVAVTPASPITGLGGTRQFAATATYSDGSTRDVTVGSTWASATPAVATINASTGMATAVSVGTSVISAGFGGKTANTTLTIVTATLSSIAITPTSPTVLIGATRQFVLIATYSNGSVANVSSTSTFSSATPAALTIGATSGLATGIAAGSSVITGSYGGMTANTTATVPAVTLSSIAVTPANATVGIGGIQQFVATGTYSDGSNAIITSSASWTSGTIANGTIASTGAATGIAVGTTTITATSGTKNGSAVLTIAAVAPPPPAAGAGLNLGRAASFGVLAGTSITNNSGGTTLIMGDVGAPSQTTDPVVGPGFVNLKSGAVLDGALADLQVAITEGNGRACDVNFPSGIDLGGLTLAPGVYCYAGAINITGTLFLNGPGVYIFRTALTLNATANAIVALTNGATADNVYWLPVGPSTLGANGVFKGSILGQSAAITVGDNTTLLNGRVLSGAAVTLRNNQITK